MIQYLKFVILREQRASLQGEETSPSCQKRDKKEAKHRNNPSGILENCRNYNNSWACNTIKQETNAPNISAVNEEFGFNELGCFR